VNVNAAAKTVANLRKYIYVYVYQCTFLPIIYNTSYDIYVHTYNMYIQYVDTYLHTICTYNMYIQYVHTICTYIHYVHTYTTYIHTQCTHIHYVHLYVQYVHTICITIQPYYKLYKPYCKHYHILYVDLS
jgi:hypothetical protein